MSMISVAHTDSPLADAVRSTDQVFKIRKYLPNLRFGFYLADFCKAVAVKVFKLQLALDYAKSEETMERLILVSQRDSCIAHLSNSSPSISYANMELGRKRITILTSLVCLVLWGISWDIIYLG